MEHYSTAQFGTQYTSVAVTSTIGVDGMDRASWNEFSIHVRQGQPCAAPADTDDQCGVQQPRHLFDQGTEREPVARQSQTLRDNSRLPFIA